MPAQAANGTSATLTGSIVLHKLVGYQPDFDPIKRVIIDAWLRHLRAGSAVLPDARLVLSLYLENFQFTTTPILPDLLHPDQIAGGLGGYMQGKAVLINAQGHTVYQGIALAEVFLDNSVHLLIDFSAPGAAMTTLRLLSTFILDTSLRLRGEAHSAQLLPPAIMRAPRGTQPGWRSIISGLVVHVPPQMGTVGVRPPSGTAAPPGTIVLPVQFSGTATPTAPPAATPLPTPLPTAVATSQGTSPGRLLAGGLVVVAALGGLVWLWLSRGARGTRGRSRRS
jgi:hypothetical protein